MRVALVTPRYRPAIGGVEVHVERLASGLAEGGHEVDVLTQVQRGSVGSEEGQPDGVVVRRFPTLINGEHYAFAPALAAYLIRHSDRYDLVHAHNYHALPALAAAQAAKGNLVLTPHYHGVSESTFRTLLHRPYRVAGNWMMRRASRVISVAHSEAELLARDFPKADARISVIPNGVDARSLDSAAPYEKDGKTVVFSAGRLERYKNVDFLIRAIGELDESFVLRIAGDGSARVELENLIAEHGLSERVRLLGRVDRADLLRWFRTADVYVSMSEIEAMGISILEGLYAGANVVASDIPAHREIAELCDAELTLVNRATSAADLAAVIASASTAGDSRSPAVPTWGEVVARTETVYRDVARAKRSSPTRLPSP